MYDSYGNSVFSLAFEEEGGGSYPQLIINNNDNNNERMTLIEGSSIAGHASIPNTNWDMYWIIDKNGIYFRKRQNQFNFYIDDYSSDVSMGGVMQKLPLTRFNPGFLPASGQAKSGEIYVNSDGILRLKP